MGASFPNDCYAYLEFTQEELETCLKMLRERTKKTFDYYKQTAETENPIFTGRSNAQRIPGTQLLAQLENNKK
jgi:hypothetical protein